MTWRIMKNDNPHYGKEEDYWFCYLITDILNNILI